MFYSLMIVDSDGFELYADRDRTTSKAECISEAKSMLHDEYEGFEPGCRAEVLDEDGEVVWDDEKTD